MIRGSFFLDCISRAKASQAASEPSIDERDLVEKTNEVASFHFRRKWKEGAYGVLSLAFRRTILFQRGFLSSRFTQKENITESYEPGVKIRPSGEKYQGFLLKQEPRLPHGFGKYYSGAPYYIMYEGGWSFGLANGWGVKTNLSGKKYEGQFLEDECHGFGRLSGRDFTYEGEWKNDLPDGFGIKTDLDGEKYEGEFKKGFFHGKGVITYSDGMKYEGDFMYDLPHGTGTQTWPNGETYTGEFINGVVKLK